MQALEKMYPKTAKIFSIGDNDDGVEIYALRVSANPEAMDPKKIGQIVVSTHHGNELGAPEFTMYFLNELLKRYNSEELFRGNLADMEWTFIPVLNISGYNIAKREEKGMDPNRDYPGPCHNGNGGKLKSIRRLMEFSGSRKFTGSLTVHGYLGALTYPWGVSVGNTHTNDHNQFNAITAKAASYNGYQYGTSTDIVYPINGAYEDWAYWKYGMWSLLLELKTGNAEDIRKSSLAIQAYFDGLDSSPSLKNQLTSDCNRGEKPDLHIE
jgi:carboxypeptidase T